MICATASITVTADTISLCLKHRLKHIPSSGPYLSSNKAANFAMLLSPYKPCSSLHLWNDTPIFILVIPLAVQFFLFTLLFLISVFLWCGYWWGIYQLCCCCLFSASVYRLALNVSDQLRADTASVWGRGTYTLREGGELPAAYAREWLTPLRHSSWLWLVVFIRSGGFLQIKLGPLGGATDSWPVSYSTVRS